MSGGDAMPEDALDALAAGVYSPTDAEARELAAEVLRLREARDDAGDACDVLVRRVWEAATGDTHEGPASVDVLLEAVAGLRTRVEKAEAARDALRAAARHYFAVEDATAFTHEADAQCAEAKARLRTLAGEG